jgi:hypothetical protein
MFFMRRYTAMGCRDLSQRPMSVSIAPDIPADREGAFSTILTPNVRVRGAVESVEQVER